ncbi:MAG: malate dehydrogenase (quinone) [Myxococcaceae bacterium]|nr:malate dehydrogenase (quinone) [Myxococcaceae bacterium]
MSATLAALLRKLDPSLKLEIYERLDGAAAESSDAWNNAGTGHSGFCELNYTPEAEDGTVDVSKAIRIAEQYELSKQLWLSLVELGDLPARDTFVRTVPHLSFVRGEDDVAYLEQRWAKLSRSPLFQGFELSEDPSQLAEWLPLVMEGRAKEPVAATSMATGTDVNFGALTRALLSGQALHCGHEVLDVRRVDGGWELDVREVATGSERSVRARFVFIGAGGYSLPLLEKSGIPEAKGYGAFPVSGQWLKCTNREVIARHHAKVYGKAAVGTPPMSVPHLDTRWIAGERHLLFGPYAGITTKFLKEGSWLDLLKSVGIDNIVPVLRAGLSSIDLTQYLIGQALWSVEDRLDLLREYCPTAYEGDWEVQVAGLRVQVIQRDASGGGVLKFGTEVVTSADGSIAALLGASPGASTAVAIMLELLERCFPERMASSAWQWRCAELMPSFGKSLHADAKLCREMRARWAAAAQ